MLEKYTKKLLLLTVMLFCPGTSARLSVYLYCLVIHVCDYYAALSQPWFLPTLIINNSAKDAIKNEAIYVTFTQYFRDRKAVEARFREAIQNRWNAAPPLHCVLDQFHLGRIEIPQSVGQKQLEAKIQNERNDQESFLQQAQVEREMTAVQVNTIYLEEQKVLRTARAEASLIRSKGQSEASKLVANAQTEGTFQLVQAADISGQEQLTAFTYIRTLQQRDNVEMSVNYLTPDNIVKTQAV